MALSSDQLEAFLTVAQTLNFTKAANSLHITQSALSQRIMKLERELETALFIRDRSGLRLTETAEALVRYCLCKNSLEAEFLNNLRGENASGIVRIGGFSSVMQSAILPSLKGLLTANPQVKLQMVVDEMSELPARLKRGEIDYMILDRREDRDEFERILLGHEKNVLVQKRKYKGPDIYLDHNENDPTTHAYLKMAGLKTKKIERRYLANIYGLIEGVRLGLGRAVVPKHLITNEKEIEILHPQTVLEIPVYLYFYSQPYYSKLHKHVVDSIVEGTKSIF